MEHGADEIIADLIIRSQGGQKRQKIVDRDGPQYKRCQQKDKKGLYGGKIDLPDQDPVYGMVEEDELGEGLSRLQQDVPHMDVGLGAVYAHPAQPSDKCYVHSSLLVPIFTGLEKGKGKKG